jgi:T5orf172 domain
MQLANNGLFKVGRTKNIKSRNSGHNTIHPTGDKVRILSEFKVNSSVLVENIIKAKLDGLRPNKDSEFFLCPYDLLHDVVFRLKQHSFKSLDWTSGLDMTIFHETIRLVTDGIGASDGIELTKFNVTNATNKQKQAFISRCVEAYKETIPQEEPITWREFQQFLIKELEIPKSRFKANDWKPFLKQEENDKALVVAWRKLKE